MSVSPRVRPEALAWLRGQVTDPTQDWTNLCQMLTRMAWGIPVLFGSAYAQWLGADDEDKHVGGKIEDAPMGAALCTKGSNPAGHIFTAAHDFRSGAAAGFSNDLVHRGDVNKVHRTAPLTAWGHRYLGYLTAVNHYDLQLGRAVPVPRPKQVRYKAISAAIEKMGLALDTAKAQDDSADVTLLTKEIEDLKALDAKIRRNA